MHIYIWSKVDNWNVNCARATALNFDTRTDVLVNVSKFLHYDDVIMGAMASQITSLTIDYSTVHSGADQRKHQSSDSLASVQGIHRGPVDSPHKWPVTRKMFPFDDVIMETENVSTWGGLELPIFGFMPNALTYWAIRARHLLSHVFEYWLWRCRYFLSKVNIWNVNYARATAFIFDTRTDVLVKVSKFLRQKMFRPEGDSITQPSDSCRML